MKFRDVSPVAGAGESRVGPMGPRSQRDSRWLRLRSPLVWGDLEAFGCHPWQMPRLDA